jgi:hypothetical protein
MAVMNKNDVNKYLSSRGKTYERSSNSGGHGNVKSYRDLPNNSNNTTDRMMIIRDTRMNKNNINNYLSGQQDHYSTIHYDKGICK